MEILNFIKTFWVQIVFVCTILISIIKIILLMIDAMKCSLRNDILSVYDRCKDKKQITHYQLQSIKYSSEIYFRMKGNSFVEDIVKRVEKFEVID